MELNNKPKSTAQPIGLESPDSESDSLSDYELDERE